MFIMIIMLILLIESTFKCLKWKEDNKNDYDIIEIDLDLYKEFDKTFKKLDKMNNNKKVIQIVWFNKIIY